MYIPHFRKSSQNVPILSGKEINDIAEKFILDFSPDLIHHPQEVNIEAFLECYLGLQLDYQYLSNDCRYLGMTVFNDTDKVIVYIPEFERAEYIHADHGTVIIDTNLLEEKQEHRYRFTLGHECGHWIFHRAYYGYDPYQLTLFELNTPYVQCREINGNYLDSNTKNWDSLRWMEWQADKFSAAILMPKTAVKCLLGHNNTFNSSSDAYPAIRSVAQVFNVSMQAAYYRLCDLQVIAKTVTNDNIQLSFL